MNNPGEYRSKWMQFCSYLHCTRSLRYLRTEIGEQGLAFFIFADPDGEGPNLEFLFSQGAMAPAVTLFGSQNFLRKQMQAARDAQNHLGDPNHVSTHHAR